MIFYDAWYNIMLYLDYEELNHLNQSKISKDDTKIINLINKDEHFWKVKMETDFNIGKIKSWKHSYHCMISAINYLNLKDIQLKIIVNVDEEPKNIIIDDVIIPTAFSENANIEYIFTSDEYSPNISVIFIKEKLYPCHKKPDKIVKDMFYHRDLDCEEALKLLYLLIANNHYVIERNI